MTMDFYTAGHFTKSMQLYLNVRFRVWGKQFHSFLKRLKYSPHFIFGLQLSVSKHKSNWIHKMYLHNVTFQKNKNKQTKNACASSSQQKFWHNLDLKNVCKLIIFFKTIKMNFKYLHFHRVESLLTWEWHYCIVFWLVWLYWQDMYIYSVLNRTRTLLYITYHFYW